MKMEEISGSSIKQWPNLHHFHSSVSHNSAINEYTSTYSKRDYNAVFKISIVIYNHPLFASVTRIYTHIYKMSTTFSHL